MQKWLAAGAVMAGLLLVATPVRAQYGASKVEVRTQCLSDKDMDSIRFLQSLTRSTTKDDPVMPFNPDYFVGTWSQNWVNSEVPWSSAGQNEGTATFKYIENCQYEGDIEATGPDGPYTVKVQLVYHPARNFLIWTEADSRGFARVRYGDIGGHGPMSQQFDYRFETIPFTFEGKLIRESGTVFLIGPTQARQDVVLSIDGVTQRLGAPTLDRTSPIPDLGIAATPSPR